MLMTRNRMDFLHFAFVIVILLLHTPLPIAEVRVSSSTFQLDFPSKFTIDVMDSFLIGNCLHMSLHVNGRQRSSIISGLSSLTFESQKDFNLFQVNR